MLERTNVLGIGVSAVNMPVALSVVKDWIDHKERSYVCVTGVHGVMEGWQSSALRVYHNDAGMVLPDGMPLVWLLKIAGFRDADRVCGPEFMPRLIQDSVARGDRHFFYGGSEVALAALQIRLKANNPGVNIVGRCSPPYRPLTSEEDAAIVRQINDANPDIVWVGLSTPKQERWMAEHRDLLNASVLIGVGAAFDMQAGLVSRAPMFIRRSGFEWTYRLFKEPRRLWRRYLSSNPLFVLLVTLQKLGLYRPSLLTRRDSAVQDYHVGAGTASLSAAVMAPNQML